jgi:hypothetical protein
VIIKDVGPGRVKNAWSARNDIFSTPMAFVKKSMIIVTCGTKMDHAALAIRDMLSRELNVFGTPMNLVPVRIACVPSGKVEFA